LKPVPAIMSLAGTIILISSVFLPWVTIDIVLARADLTLYDLLTMGNKNGDHELSANSSSEVLLTLSIVFFFASLIAGAIGVLRHGAGAVAGTLAILSAITWLIGVAELKEEIASSTGLGPLVSSAVNTGSGPYLLFASSVLFFASFILGRGRRRQA